MKNYFYSERERGIIIFTFMGKTYNLPPKESIDCPIITPANSSFHKQLHTLVTAKAGLGLKLVTQDFIYKMNRVVELVPELDAEEVDIATDDFIEDVVGGVIDFNYLTKRELSEYASKNHGLEFDTKKMLKADMIAEILKAQE